MPSPESPAKRMTTRSRYSRPREGAADSVVKGTHLGSDRMRRETDLRFIPPAVPTAATGLARLSPMNEEQLQKMGEGAGFIAALDQSGGSTPKALKLYGVSEDSYSGDDEMFDRIHDMRTRIIKSPAFNGDRILGAILFEQTMDRQIDGLDTGDYLWSKKNVIPFLKIDKGLEARGRRRAAHEADARPRRPAQAGRGQERLRHQGAVGHQAGQPCRRESHRRPAVRRRPPGPGPRPGPDPRAGDRHPLPGEGPGRGTPQAGPARPGSTRCPTASR